MFEYEAKVIRVVDADTVELMIDLGCHTHVNQKLRIIHSDGSAYDAPETRLSKKVDQAHKERGLEAKKEAKLLLAEGTIVTINTRLNKTGKYGRYLAAVRLPNGIDYADHMTKNGHIK